MKKVRINGGYVQTVDEHTINCPMSFNGSEAISCMSNCMWFSIEKDEMGVVFIYCRDNAVAELVEDKT